jgi:hypothetical protein
MDSVHGWRDQPQPGARRPQADDVSRASGHLDHGRLSLVEHRSAPGPQPGLRQRSRRAPGHTARPSACATNRRPVPGRRELRISPGSRQSPPAQNDNFGPMPRADQHGQRNAPNNGYRTFRPQRPASPGAGCSADQLAARWLVTWPGAARLARRHAGWSGSPCWSIRCS